MGIFSRHKKDDDAGAVSQPEGDGPVTLEDRTEPGGEGSPDTNQGKTEPISPTPGRNAEAIAIPDLSDMSAGAAGAAQAPSNPAAQPLSPAGSYGGGDAGDQPMGLGGPGVAPDGTRPDIDTETSTGRSKGPQKPVQTSTGEAHRVGGLNGTTPEGESIETDTEAGATRMGDAPPDAVDDHVSGHGDTGPSPSTGEAAAPGTSESQPRVEGIRLPEA